MRCEGDGVGLLDAAIAVRSAAPRDTGFLSHRRDRSGRPDLGRGRIIATLDGDLQNDPADLPMMLKELETYDLVCGLRTN